MELTYARASSIGPHAGILDAVQRGLGLFACVPWVHRIVKVEEYRTMLCKMVEHFPYIYVFIKILICLSKFWFVYQNFDVLSNV